MVLNLPRPHSAGPVRLATGAGLVLSLILGLAQAGPVAAADPPSMLSEATATAGLVARLAAAPDPARLFRSLPSADQHSVTGYLSASRFTSSQQLGRRTSGGTVRMPPRGQAALLAAAATAGAGCWTWKWERDAYNLIGLKLWAYYQEIDWCDDGLVILGSPQVLSYGATWFPFWTWIHAGDRAWGGSGQATFRAWTQADFSLCLTPNIGCIQSTYPWLDMTAHANGTGTGSAG
jgi:hypothetical protein